MKIKKIIYAVSSGILLGLSTGAIPGTHTAFLEWAGFVPLLLALKDVSRFRDYFMYTIFTFLIFFFIAIYPFFGAYFFGGLIILLLGSLEFTVPLIVLFFLKKKISWTKSLFLLPFVWTIYEYFFIQSKFSLGVLSVSVIQAPYLWLVQFVDVLGSGALTFWVLLLNVMAAYTILGLYEVKDHRKRNFILRNAVLILLMFIIPLLYSAYIFNSKDYNGGKEVTVSLVQPDINAQKKWQDSVRAAAVYNTISLTDSLLKVRKTDLVIWPEAAVPYVLMHEKIIRDTVFDSVREWNTPLLTGTVDWKYYYDSTKVPPLAKYLHRNYEMYNCAMMITPQLASLSKVPGFEFLKVKSYKKNDLMPITEYVPYADKFPVLSNLCLDFGGGANWSPGKGPTTLLFADSKNNRVEVSPAICWDIIYPETIIKSAKDNRGFLAFISNEGWFGKTLTPYEIENFTRLRSIETRRSIAKCGNTGYTFFTDPLGRVYGKIPWWRPLTSTNKVKLSSAQTFYMSQPGLFPEACAAASILLFMIFLGKKKRIANNKIKGKTKLK